MHKIAHFTSVHPRNDPRILHKECVSLAERNYSVDLYVADGLAHEMWKAVRIRNLGIRRPGRFERFILTSLRFARVLKNTSYDLYHFHDPELIPVGLLLKLLGKKVIYDAHEDLPRQILSKPYIPKELKKFVGFAVELIENLICNKFDCIVAATPHIAARFSALMASTVCLNNFPLLSEFQSPVTRSLERRELCYVGGLTRIRGIEQIVDAAEYIHAKIALAGEFESNKFKDAMSQRPGWKHIRYTGLLSREDVRCLFAQCLAGLVLFLPEPNHVSAQPNKLFEYMSAGLPVIASNFPLWREIVEGNNCGICVDPTDPKMIANAINEIITNPDTACEMGRNGRQAIENLYNWESEQKKLIDLYSNLLSNPCEHSSY